MMTTGQGVVLCGQEDNHRSVIILAMHHSMSVVSLPTGSVAQAPFTLLSKVSF